MTFKAKDAEERYGQASKEAEDLRKRVEELEKVKNQEPVKLVETTVDIDGKQYYTDEALLSKVEAGELTQADAYKLQRARDKAELKKEVMSEITTETKQTEEQRIREEDQRNVLSKYPQFSKTHPDFNPDDPLYKEVNRLWNNGYAHNPKGMSEAIKDAKKILRMQDTNPGS